MQKTKVTKQRNHKSARTTVSLPSEDYEELEKIAVKNRVSVAWVIREAVSHYLAEQVPLLRQR
jgi:predicted transcriptional regulator